MPLHPFLAHIPLVLALFMPVILGVSVFFIMRKKVTPQVWWVAVAVQVLVVMSAYIALSSGEGEEDLVSQFVSKKFIGQHENMAEMFSGLSVILLGVMVVINFVQEKIAKHLRILATVFSIIPLSVGLYAGRLGGQIAYAEGGAEAYYGTSYESEEMGILPTPGMNTSESDFPVNELELNNPDSDFEEFERENGGDPNTFESLPEDDSFSEDEEDRTDQAE